MPRPSRAARVLPATVAVLLALAGCGGSGDDPSTGPAVPDAGDRGTALVTAVCGSATRGVRPVPGPDASAAEGRAYVRDVVAATRTLTADLDGLAARVPERRDDLRELASRARDVLAVARRTTDGRAAEGANDLAGAIARLNLSATRARLLPCGL